MKNKILFLIVVSLLYVIVILPNNNQINYTTFLIESTRLSPSFNMQQYLNRFSLEGATYFIYKKNDGLIAISNEVSTQTLKKVGNKPHILLL
ncbi:hypothetical protein ACFSTE_09100 [Aquimarina hainanensis]|uniref:Spi protease inhibitor domain-containing protein n=1 Tax=Aquimarina hainanensis TaxID=1578017 RepID=A0ABW5N829_9FLAO|nr:hypothetical protein [Aquimarina sp. TRL1]QKX03857.1 hypothetical protein HN014_02685 [Aquimarina sp. TRL1]